MILLQVSGLGQGISFTQSLHQRLAIAGETGSGKSTLLKTIGGLQTAEKGEVLFEGNRVLGPLERLIPGHPGIAYLSQHFELWNNYRVSEILSYANELSDEESTELYRVCRIDHLLSRRTDQLSGGERQRISLAKLLVKPPKLLLLDEPFSNLDMIHKSILKSVIRDLGDRMGITCMLVSHDPVDLLSWADEILVIKDGYVVQQDTPERIYRQPKNEYVAGLFGRYNLLKGEFIRPEDIWVEDGQGEALAGQVKRVTFVGSHYDVEVMTGEGMLLVRTLGDELRPGQPVLLYPGKTHRFEN